MAAERRKGERVTFEHGIGAHMMGIDGTWRRGLHRGTASQGILPAAVVHRTCLPPLRTRLGQWRSNRGHFPEAGRQEEKGNPARRDARRRRLNALRSYNRHLGRLWR